MSDIALKIRMFDNVGLCGTCSNAQVMRSGTATVVHCHALGREVASRVDECNRYAAVNMPDIWAMKEAAWTLRTEKNGRVIGFSPPKKEREPWEL